MQRHLLQRACCGIMLLSPDTCCPVCLHGCGHPVPMRSGPVMHVKWLQCTCRMSMLQALDTCPRGDPSFVANLNRSFGPAYVVVNPASSLFG